MSLKRFIIELLSNSKKNFLGECMYELLHEPVVNVKSFPRVVNRKNHFHGEMWFL